MLKAMKYLSAAFVALFLTGVAFAQDADPQVTLFTNVNVFDGSSEKLIRNANVVVTGNKISAVSTTRPDTCAPWPSRWQVGDCLPTVHGDAPFLKVTSQ